MNKIILTVVLILCTSLAQAELYEVRTTDGALQFSDRVTNLSGARRHNRSITHPLAVSDLPGTWEANSDNGRKTALTLNSNGSFVFDQSSDTTLHRVYMCGTWQGAEKSLALVVKAAKRQLESGDIEQAAGAYQEAATILSAQRDRIILLIQGEKLVFNRTS